MPSKGKAPAGSTGHEMPKSSVEGDRRLITIYDRECRYIEGILNAAGRGDYTDLVDGYGRPVSILPTQLRVIENRIAELRASVDRRNKKGGFNVAASSDPPEE